MKIRSSSFSKKTISLQSFLIAGGLASMSAQGMVPVEFGQWTASGNTISTNCPSNYKCTVGISDKNFYQEIMQETDAFGNVLANGKKFFRQIINEGDMVDESIVRANNIASLYDRHGIANNQYFTMSQTTPSSNTNFSTGSTLYSGWASSASAPDLHVFQNIDETSRKAGEGGVYLEGYFNSSANIKANYDESGARTGFEFSLDQSMSEPGEYGGTTTGTYNGVDEQVFAIRGKSGNMLTDGGTLTLDGSTLNWNAGHDLWAVALGQNFHHSTVTGDGNIQLSDNSTAGWQDLGVMFESYDNRSDTVDGVNYFAYFENNTNAWPTVFGPAPVLPASTGDNGDETVVAPASPLPTIVTGLFTPTAVGPAQTDGRNPPVAFDQWVLEADGAITAQGATGTLVDPTTTQAILDAWTTTGDGTAIPQCDAGELCESGNINSAGMTQRIVVDETGHRYVQTVITDPNSGFTSESFVSVATPGTFDGVNIYSGSNVTFTGGYSEETAENGIALKQVNSHDTSIPGLTQTMDSVVNIATGWAANSATPNVSIAQNMNATGFNAMEFDQQFAYSGNLDAAGNTIGSMVDIHQYDANMLNQYQMTPQTVAGLNSDIQFTHRSRSGNLQQTSGDIPGVLTWNAGDKISATNIFLRFDGGRTTGGWGVTFYDNLVDNLAVADVGFAFDGYTGVGADWIASAFGAEPVYAAIPPVTVTVTVTGGGGGGGGGGKDKTK